MHMASTAAVDTQHKELGATRSWMSGAFKMSSPSCLFKMFETHVGFTSQERQ